MYSKIYLRLEPLGLELVASAARGAGHDVRLIDLQAETHKDYFRWIRSWSPDAVVFSCNYLANVPEIIDLAKATRTLLPEALIMVGGHSASFTATEILQHGEGSIDAVLKGEGEPVIVAVSGGGPPGPREPASGARGSDSSRRGTATDLRAQSRYACCRPAICFGTAASTLSGCLILAPPLSSVAVALGTACSAAPGLSTGEVIELNLRSARLKN